MTGIILLSNLLLARHPTSRNTWDSCRQIFIHIRSESYKPQYALRSLQLRTKAATLKLPQWLDGYRDKILASLAHCYRSALRIGEFPCRLLRTKNHHFAKLRW